MFHFALVISGASLKSISLSGLLASRRSFVFCAPVRGGSVSLVYLVILFFIELPLLPSRTPCGDDPYHFGSPASFILFSDCMSNQKKDQAVDFSVCPPALLSIDDVVLNRYAKWIEKHPGCFFEADAVLALIGEVLALIPFEQEIWHYNSVTTN
jgi:hypothetical protein